MLGYISENNSARIIQSVRVSNVTLAVVEMIETWSKLGWILVRHRLSKVSFELPYWGERPYVAGKSVSSQALASSSPSTCERS
jgi:predicted RNA binding protein YcfA (HicA-like mRNA interferase family)